MQHVILIILNQTAQTQLTNNLFKHYRFKTVGPFVVMIYRMLSGDLLRFVTIYLIFVMGFSQAYYIIFLSYHRKGEPNPVATPAEAIVAMFMASLANFQNLYENFKYTKHANLAKVCENYINN